LETGDLVSAHKWARRGLAIDPDGPLARANMAMVLAYLNRNGDAAALLAGTRSNASTNRAAQIYLDRLTLASPSLGQNGNQPAPESQYLDEPEVPELEWRLDNARKGIRSYLSGDDGTASEQLAKSLDGRAYPIKRTDYDLFLCTSLADSYGRQGKGSESTGWLARCDRNLTDAIKHGWKTLALAYVEARVSMLHQDRTAALDRLAALVELGFGNRQLLEVDPVFAAIRGDARFREIGARIAARVERAWTEISSASH
jgi:thioredoxin-like negative regulator of GroEL